MPTQQTNHDTSATRLLSMRQVTALTTYSRPSIYRLVDQGRFPHPIKLGDVKIAFRADEVESWIANRPRALGGDDIPPPANPT